MQKLSQNTAAGKKWRQRNKPKTNEKPMAHDQKQEIDLGITRLEYDDPARPQRATLTLTTSKHSSGGLSSEATVFWIGFHSRQHAYGLAGGGDFIKRLLINKAARATQSNIDRQHSQVFTPSVIEELTNAAKQYYAK